MGTQCDSATLPDAVSPCFKDNVYRTTGKFGISKNRNFDNSKLINSREGSVIKDEVRRPARCQCEKSPRD